MGDPRDKTGGLSPLAPDFERIRRVRECNSATIADLARAADLDPATDFRFGDWTDADWRHTDVDQYDLTGSLHSGTARPARPPAADYDDMDRDELAVAHRLFRKYVERFGAANIKRNYFPNIGIGTIKNLAKSSSPTGKAEETRDALTGFHEQVIMETVRKTGFYDILKLLFDCGNQDEAAKYVGKYICYRFQSGTENLLGSTVSVDYDKAKASYNFTHMSRDSVLNSTVPLLSTPVHSTY